MQFAFSTVLGGMPCYATDCTYEDTIELLMTCPICSSAVHLRSASDRTYKKSGITVVSNPYFAHYKAGNADDFNCSARCKSSSARQVLLDREAYFKGQRLEWYNDRLWLAAQADRRITPRILTGVIRMIGISSIRKRAKDFRANYKKARPVLVQNIFESALCSDTLERDLREFSPSDDDFSAALTYFGGANKKLHTEIAMEILDFLGTSSGGYALEKIIPASMLLLYEAGQRTGQTFINAELWARLDMDSIYSAVTSFVISTHWVDQFYPQLKESGKLR
jgi:hypothetical protein